MNDLSGLKWNSNPTSQPLNRTGSQQGPARSTPSPGFSRQSTPGSGSGQANASKLGSSAGVGPTKGSGADLFSNLLAPQPARPAAASLSLEERQRQLNAQKSQATGTGDPFAASDAQFWEGLGSGRGTPAPPEPQRATAQDEDDILAAFNSAAPVDKSSHFPPPNRSNLTSPQPSASRGRSPASETGVNGSRQSASNAFDDDDDPFGLGQMAQKRAAPAGQPSHADDDDILGDLAKPVEETLAERQRQESAQSAQSANAAHGLRSGGSPRDKALAELVDMGFDVDKARRALAQTTSGDDVQGAIGVLLNDAHKESGGGGRSNSQARGAPAGAGSTGGQRTHSHGKPDKDSPAWMRKHQDRDRSNGRSPAGEDKELSQYATEIGATVWKSANTFWKAGQKRMAKAVAELQQEADSSQPRWMREVQPQEPRAKAPADGRQPHRSGAPTQDNRHTSEAAMLDMGAPPSRQKANGAGRESSAASRAPPRSSADTRFSEGVNGSRAAPLPERAAPRPSSRPVERLSRKAVEEETSQAYVSPARRKKAEPKSQPPPESAETLDIFSDVQAPPPARASAPAPAPAGHRARQNQPSGPAQPRPAAPARPTPQVSPSVINSSMSHRKSGGEAFKQGDYATAHSSYTKALTGMPPKHPTMIVLYSNRALTSLKTGDAKGAISDADAALAIIGPSNGDGESIDLGDEGQKPMRDFFGKALMRKAEALEHLEKWSEATQVWRVAVEAGVGGAVAIQGRNRCEKAASPAPPKPAGAAAPIKRKVQAARPTPRPSALAELNGKAEGEAVKRLREQTAAAAAASDEAFALTDSVDARLAAWKSGKAENLRALLASLDTVLWASAGWNKVGMGDLVLPNRVKIVYMKAIAKVHPDKLSQTATTEQKMISASVFATLNEAWDKFKKDNGM